MRGRPSTSRPCARCNISESWPERAAPRHNSVTTARGAWLHPNSMMQLGWRTLSNTRTSLFSAKSVLASTERCEAPLISFSATGVPSQLPANTSAKLPDPSNLPDLSSSESPVISVDAKPDNTSAVRYPSERPGGGADAGGTEGVAASTAAGRSGWAVAACSIETRFRRSPVLRALPFALEARAGRIGGSPSVRSGCPLPRTCADSLLRLSASTPSGPAEKDV
mmetsp:Transcript_1195/g.3167  ORF Transcript_1195/g.3167 Transcript_1195/m.3167 type:complete len:223 (-) Transcript_1195:1489-2157(-)